MKSKKFSDNEKKQMAVDYAGGMSLKQLACRFNISVPTMAKYVRQGGGIVRKKGKVRARVTSEVVSNTTQPFEEQMPLFVQPVETTRVLLPID